MDGLRKLLIGLIGGVAIVGWCISASYLLVNLKEIPGKILQRQDIQENEIRETSSDFENPSKNPEESILFSKKIDTLFSSDSKNKLRVYIHLLETMSVDLSAVTPFILLWFFSSLVLNSWKILKDKVNEEKAKIIGTFPFYRNYEMTWIQLGFTGTLWGFLIIGWRMHQTQSGTGQLEVLDILLKAFGTALLSTFTAVVMVYIITPLVKSVYWWGANIRIGVGSVDNVHIQLEKLSNELENSTKALSGLNQEVDNLMKKIKSGSFDRLKSIDKKLDTLTTEIKNISSNTKEERTEIIKILSKLQKELVSSEGQIPQRFDMVNDTVKSGNKALQEAIKERQKDIQEQTGQIREKFDMLDAAVREQSKTLQDNVKSAKESIQQQINHIQQKFDIANIAIEEQSKTLQKNFEHVRNDIQIQTGQIKQPLDKLVDLLKKLQRTFRSYPIDKPDSNQVPETITKKGFFSWFKNPR